MNEPNLNELDHSELLKHFKSSYLDCDYSYQDKWNVSSIRHHSNIDDSGYLEKQRELNEKGYGIHECYCFLLFPNSPQKALSSQPSCTFMKKQSQKPWSPSESLGSFNHGIVMFKSADPLLKLATLLRLKAVKLGIYKVLVCQQKSNPCTLQNVNLVQPILTSDFDSSVIKIDSEIELKYLNLDIQLRMSEIYIHDWQAIEVNGNLVQVSRSCPRQVLPMGFLQFHALSLPVSITIKKEDKMQSKRSGLRVRSKSRSHPCICCSSSNKKQTNSSATSCKSKQKHLGDISKKSVPSNKYVPASSLECKQQCSGDAPASVNSTLCESPTAKVDQQPLNDKDNSCGEDLEKLLDALSDQPLLDLCKDAGLLPSTPLSLPTDTSANSSTLESSMYNFFNFQPGVNKTSEDCALPSDSLSSPLSLENVQVGNISLLDDICNLIDSNLNDKITPEVSSSCSLTSQASSIMTSLPSHSVLLQAKSNLSEVAISSESQNPFLHTNQHLPSLPNSPTQASSASSRGKSTEIPTAKPRKKIRKKTTVSHMEKIVEIKIKKKVKEKVVINGAKQRQIKLASKYLPNLTSERDWRLNLRRFYQRRQKVAIRSIKSSRRLIVDLEAKSSIKLPKSKSFSKSNANSSKLERSYESLKPMQSNIISEEKAIAVSQNVVEHPYLSLQSSNGSVGSLSKASVNVPPILPNPMPKSKNKQASGSPNIPPNCDSFPQSHSDWTNASSQSVSMCQSQFPCFYSKPHKTNFKVARPAGLMPGPYGVFYQLVPVVRFAEFPASNWTPNPFPTPEGLWNGYGSSYRGCHCGSSVAANCKCL